MISRFDGLCAPINEKVMALGSRAMNRFKCDVRIGGGVGRAQCRSYGLARCVGGGHVNFNLLKKASPWRRKLSPLVPVFQVAPL